MGNKAPFLLIYMYIFLFYYLYIQYGFLFFNKILMKYPKLLLIVLLIQKFGAISLC